MPYSVGRSGTAWLKVQAQVYEEETHCWWCRQWVDQSLSRRHPMSRTVDHIHEMWQGGDPLDRSNLRLAHRRCNSRKSIEARTRARGRREGYTVDASSL